MSHISGDADNHKTEIELISSNRWGSDIKVDEKLVAERLLEIKKEIAPCNLRIIGVTKYFGLDAIVSGYNAGIRDFGESRANDAIKKIEALPNEIRENSKFHFIGHLQSNKVEKVVKNFDYIQSIDSLKLAQAVSQVACSLNKREKVLLQVNVSGEEQKFGYEVEALLSEIPELIKLAGLDITGLMCMAPFGAEEKLLREVFSNLRKLRDAIEKEFGIVLPELSMGMSDDYKVAIDEGATMIRIGRKLFK